MLETYEFMYEVVYHRCIFSSVMPLKVILNNYRLKTSICPKSFGCLCMVTVNITNSVFSSEHTIINIHNIHRLRGNTNIFRNSNVRTDRRPEKQANRYHKQFKLWCKVLEKKNRLNF